MRVKRSCLFPTVMLCATAFSVALGCTPTPVWVDPSSAFQVDGYSFIGKEMSEIEKDLGRGAEVVRDVDPFRDGWMFWRIPDGKGILTVYFSIDGSRRVAESFGLEKSGRLLSEAEAPECKRIKKSEVRGVAIDLHDEFEGSIDSALGEPMFRCNWETRIQNKTPIIVRATLESEGLGYRVRWHSDE